MPGHGGVDDQPEVDVVHKEDVNDQRANESPPSCFRSDRSHRRPQLYSPPPRVSCHQEEKCFSDANQANETKYHANRLASRGRRRPRGQHACLGHVAAHFRFCSRRQSVHSSSSSSWACPPTSTSSSSSSTVYVDRLIVTTLHYDSRGRRRPSEEAALDRLAELCSGELPATRPPLPRSASTDIAPHRRGRSQLAKLKVEVPNFVVCPGYTSRFGTKADEGGKVYVAGATSSYSHAKSTFLRWAAKDTESVRWWKAFVKEKSIEPVTVSQARRPPVVAS